MNWGRNLLIWGLFGLLGSAAPAVLVALLPPGFMGNFFELVAIMLTLTVTPLCAIVAVTGAIIFGLKRLR